MVVSSPYRRDYVHLFPCPCLLSLVLSVILTLQVFSEIVLDTLSPVLVLCLPFSMALHPVLPALPRLMAGAGGGASQGGIRVAQMSRHVGCERVVLGVYLDLSWLSLCPLAVLQVKFTLLT